MDRFDSLSGSGAGSIDVSACFYLPRLFTKYVFLFSQCLDDDRIHSLDVALDLC